MGVDPDYFHADPAYTPPANVLAQYDRADALDAVRQEQPGRLIDHARPPVAWRQALSAANDRGGISSMAIEGLDLYRAALRQLEKAVRLLEDAAVFETQPEAAALWANLRLVALHPLVLHDAVARGLNFRATSKIIEERGCGYGAKRSDYGERTADAQASHSSREWLARAGIHTPAPLVEDPDRWPPEMQLEDVELREKWRREKAKRREKARAKRIKEGTYHPRGKHPRKRETAE